MNDTIRFKIKKLPDDLFDRVVFLNNIALPFDLFNLTYLSFMYKDDADTFDLFTCSCGDAGCAGFYRPINHKRTDTIVEWIFPVEDYYKTEKLIYEFNVIDFDIAFSDLNSLIVEQFKLNKFPVG